jgi:hypothetical protein
VSLIQILALSLLLAGNLLVLRLVVASDTEDDSGRLAQGRLPQRQPAPSRLSRAA